MHLFCRQRAGRWSARRMWFGGQNSLKAHCDVSSVPALGSRPRQRSVRDVKDGSDDSSSSPFDEAFPRNAFRPHSKRVRTKPSTHRVHSDSNYPGYVVLYRGFVLTSTPPKQGGFGGHPQLFGRISAQSCEPRRDCNIRSVEIRRHDEVMLHLVGRNHASRHDDVMLHMNDGREPRHVASRV